MAIQREIIESEIRTSGGKQVQDEIIKVNQAIKNLAQEEKNLIFIKNKLESQGKKNTDEYKRNTEALKLNREAAAKQKEELTKLNGQLKITDMTYNQLSKRAAELRGKLNNISQSTDPAKWKAYNKELTEVTAQMGRVRAGTQQTSSVFGTMSKAAGILGISIGGVWGVLRAGKAVLESTDTTADKLQETIQGATSAWEYLKKSMATGDFSNFFRNIGEAIRAGREFAQVMDQIEDLQRSYTMLNADELKQSKELELVWRDRSKSADERNKALLEWRDIQERAANREVQVATELYNTKIDLIAAENKMNKETLESAIKDYAKYWQQYEQMAEQGVFKTYESQKRVLGKEAALNSNLIFEDGNWKALSEEQKQVILLYEDLGRVTGKDRDILVDLYEKMRQAEAAVLDNRLESLRTETQIENALENTTEASEKQVEAEQKRSDEIEKIRKALLDKLDAATREFILKQLSLQDQEIYAIADKYNLLVQEFLQSSDNRILNEQEAADAISKLWEIQAQEIFQKSIEQQAEQNAIKAEANQEYIDQELAAFQDQLTEKERLQQEADKKEEERMQRRQVQAAQIASLFGAAYDFVDQKRNNELEKLEAEYDKKIQLAGKNNTLVTKLEEERERKAKAIKKKYADVDFHLKVLQINASTAQGIMGVWGNNTLPYPAAAVFNAIMTAIIAATGITQVSAASRARNQAKSLYTGGYTGDGHKLEPAGTVHKGEYVVSSDELAAPQVRSFIGGVVEPMRMRRLGYSPYAYNTTIPGYANGGPVNGISIPDNTELNRTLGDIRHLLANIRDEGVNANFDETKIFEMRQRISRQENGEYIARR